MVLEYGMHKCGFGVVWDGRAWSLSCLGWSCEGWMGAALELLLGIEGCGHGVVRDGRVLS